MHVEVVRLRYRGEKLSKGALGASARAVGHLNVHMRWHHYQRKDVYVATLTRGEFASDEQLLPTLDQVRLGKAAGDDFLLFGVEDLSYRKSERIYLQAWWCRLRP